MAESGRKVVTVDGNESYEEDLNFSIELVRWILKSIGAWPISIDASLTRKIVSRLIQILCFSLPIFLIIPSALFMILDVEDTYTKIRLSGPMSFFFMGFFKYYYLVVREDLVKCCVRHVEIDWRNVKIPEDRETMLTSATSGRRLINICAGFMYGSAIFFYFIVPFSGGKVVSEDGNFTYRPLPIAVATIIVDARKNPYNDIFFSIQCFSGYFLFSITISCCSLAAVFIMHACGQLEVLISLLGRLVNGIEGVTDTVDDRLKDIIEHHVRTLNFIAQVEELLREISLVEIAGCTVNMCLLGYYVIMEWDDEQIIRSVTYTALLLSFMFNIFIFCYIGEQLTRQCERVGIMTYMIDWYLLPEKKGLGLILIMAMSNSSKKITAGNLFNLSLACFGDVVKTSVAYLNMLRKVTS